MQLEENSYNLDLDRAVESGLFLLPELPGELSPRAISGLQGRVTPISSPFANVVGAAQLDAQSADSAIDAVIEYFTKKIYLLGGELDLAQPHEIWGRDCSPRVWNGWIM